VPPSPPSDVRLRVNGFDLRGWKDYQIESDILQPADAFSLYSFCDCGIILMFKERFEISARLEGSKTKRRFLPWLERGKKWKTRY